MCPQCNHGVMHVQWSDGLYCANECGWSSSPDDCSDYHHGDCSGSIGVYMTRLGTPMLKCEYHEIEAYKRDDEIRAMYWDNSPDY